MKAMIFAAGLGTRLKPLTDKIPKALVPIAGKPLLEHVILKLKKAGFDEVIVNVHHFSEQIIDFIESKNHFDMRIEISDERESLLNTGGGIRKAASFFDDGKPFLVHNVDILSNVDLNKLYNQHLENGALATLLVSKRETQRYLMFDKELTLRAWKNTQTGELRPEGVGDVSKLEALAFSGIHVLSPRVFSLMEEFEPKFSIIDFYLSCVKNENIKAYVAKDLKLLDVGKLVAIEQAEKFVNEV